MLTEAEWEYSCRAGTTTDFSFGDDASELKEYAWFMQNSGRKIHPVKSREPNPWGLYGMHGNVSEWVEDDYRWNYDEAPNDSHAWMDKPRGKIRVLRGGNVDSSAGNCRSASRSDYLSSINVPFGGFRLARDVTFYD